MILSVMTLSTEQHSSLQDLKVRLLNGVLAVSLSIKLKIQLDHPASPNNVLYGTPFLPAPPLEKRSYYTMP